MPSVIYFQDVQGIWCPFTHLFYSQSSNIILSRHPAQVVEEVISSYCPQCLARFQDGEINQLAAHIPTLTQSLRGYCPNCYKCKECEGVMLKYQEEIVESTKPNEVFLLSCTNCSKSCLVDLSVGRRKIELQNNFFQTLVRNYAQLYDPENVLLKGNKDFYRAPLPSPVTKTGTWHIDDMESLLDSKRFVNSNYSIAPPINDDDESVEKCSNALYENFPLLNKRTLRSRKDMEQGKMNILIQSKLLPLEGDSSLKLNKGKWWVKDSSAIHFLPLIQLLSVRLEPEANQSYFICKVTNLYESEGKLNLSFVDRDNDSARGVKQVIDGNFQSFEIQNYWCLSSSVEYLPLELEPYEDELLKDDSEDYDLFKIITDLKSSTQEYQVISRGNTAFLRIPIVSKFCESTERLTLKAPILFSFQWSSQSVALGVNALIELY